MTTYYVATNGSNSGKGTSGSPWKTISKAMKANLKPGDEVVVRSGTYKEAVDDQQGRGRRRYITLRSEVPGGAKIDVPDGKIGININGELRHGRRLRGLREHPIRYHREPGSIMSRSPIT